MHSISGARQEQVFQQVGYQFAILVFPRQNRCPKSLRRCLQASAPKLRPGSKLEYIAFTTTWWADSAKKARADAAAAISEPLTVIEVNVKRPQPREPLVLFWKPARRPVI